jgi:putative transposase
VSILHVHLVFVIKYKCTLFTDGMLTFGKHTMRTVYAELVEFNREGDHVHLLVAYPPALAVSTLVQRLKDSTAYAVRREYTGACVRARMHGHLWSPPYSLGSSGGAPLSIIKPFVDGQAGPL